jgi:rare lipoprotein A (peptidoglycan hydrolase)/cell division protein FtsN
MAAASLLSACATQPHGISARKGGHGGSKVAMTASGAKIGAPYQIDGVWYYPREDAHYDKVGIASWYGPGFDGRPTATGEIYDMNGLTAAHTTLPLPTNVEVTNLENGRSLVLRVNDRGPFVGNRVIDVSRRAAQLLGFEQQGTAKVRVRALPDAGSNTMLASAAPPSVDTRANVAQMPGGNTQLLASSSRTASADTRMAPIPNPGGAGTGMSPIPNPVAPSPSSVVASAQLPPLPTATTHTRPEYGAAYGRDTGGAVQQRSLAAILPARRQGGVPQQPAPAYAAPPRLAAADTAPPPYGQGTRSQPRYAQAQPRLRFVVGAQPAVILSDASRGGEAAGYGDSAPASSPTIAPTLASATVSDSASTRSSSEFSSDPSADDGVYIQAGAFVDNGNAEHLRAEVGRLGRTDIETASIGGRVFHRVVIGPMASAGEADLTLAKLRQMGHPEARILSR